MVAMVSADMAQMYQIVPFSFEDGILTVAMADPPGYRAILAFAFGLAVCTAVVRIWFPIDHWDYLLGYFRVAFADVPRDLGMFIVGIGITQSPASGWPCERMNSKLFHNP